MGIDEYKRRVIDLFRGTRRWINPPPNVPQATEEQWQAMAECVLCASNIGIGHADIIDATVDPPEVKHGQK